jgi:hypothetical protein
VVGSHIRGWPAQLWMGTAATHTLVGERAMEATVRLPWYRSGTLVKPRHLVACDQGCAPPHEKEVRLGATRSIVETHICQERYCVKLLGVGRGDAVAAWPSQDRTPLNEPFERLVSDHRTPDTVYVVYSDSVLLYKDPLGEPIILRIRISNFGINKTNGPWRVACCMAKANANIDSV